jgi:hypothetical protein
MKKVYGGNFGVRFFRRGVAKDAAPELGPMPEQTAMGNADIPAQIPVLKTTEHSREKEQKLRDAAGAGDCTTIRVLVMEGVDMDARDEGGRTALNIATQYSQKGAIKTLLAAREMRRMASRGEFPESVFFNRFKPTKSA